MNLMAEVKSEIPNIIGSAVEYCIVCSSVMSSDGCSDPNCWKSRPTYPLQEALRAVALNKAYGTKNYTPAKQQRFFSSGRN